MMLPKGTTIAVADGEKLNLFRNSGDEADMKLTVAEHADVGEDVADMHPVGRLGRSEEVSALTCFLLSDEASFITGSYHLVDGGYIAQ